MDPIDILNQCRNYYFIGNYIKVLEIWNETPDANFGDYINQANFFISRAMIAQRLLQPNAQLAITKEPSGNLQAMTQSIHNFFIPLIMSTEYSEEKEQDMLMSLLQSYVQRDSFSPSSALNLIVAGYIALAAGDSNFITSRLDAKGVSSLELHFILLLHYLKIFRIDLAEKKLAEMRKIDDEDILTLISFIYLCMAKEKFEDALKYLDEVKERFGDSPKLLNLRVACYIGNRNFEDAYNLGTKVISVMSSQDQIFDKAEMEVCLINMIRLSEILEKPYDEFQNNLQNINSHSAYFKRATKNQALLSELCSQLSE